MILVTGATGTTASRVAPRLEDRGAPVRRGCRHATGPGSVLFDWGDPSTYGPALEGVDKLYLVPPTRSVVPAEVMPRLLDTARRTGVRRLVLLSASIIDAGGPGAGGAHALLDGMFDEWAVLRPSWFMQNVIGEHHLARGLRQRNALTTATEDGRIAFIDADDIADVAVHALLDDPAPNTDLVLTGPEALSYDDVAAIVSAASGRPIRHERVDVDVLNERLGASLPAATAALLAFADTLLAAGVEDRTTDEVEHVTGHRPGSFASFACRLPPGAPGPRGSHTISRAGWPSS